jgi:hypothetical protein
MPLEDRLAWLDQQLRGDTHLPQIPPFRMIGPGPLTLQSRVIACAMDPRSANGRMGKPVWLMKVVSLLGSVMVDHVWSRYRDVLSSWYCTNETPEDAAETIRRDVARCERQAASWVETLDETPEEETVVEEAPLPDVSYEDVASLFS